ncbi:hypothetical protein ABIB25_001359 [Nakamurella sp. UYEF19]|uniref:glycoside hydrolase family 16 protein n=1 Tax=Nakamurella sp. UYEF19 TaxID=1756392 RepID=UPI003394F659
MPILSSRARRVACVALAAVTLAMLALPETSAAAGPVRYAAPKLATSVSGLLATATATITASVPVTASMAGVCVRNSAGAVRDFPFRAVALKPAGTVLTATRQLYPGRYTVWACAKVDGGWNDIGAKRTLVVADPGATRSYPKPVARPGAAYPSGVPMPVGNLPGWKQVFSDDFTTPVVLGGFPGPYKSKWLSYNGFADTSGNGRYNQKIISMHNGQMDLYLHSEKGVPQGAAPVPLVGGRWGGQKYGRFTVRYRADWTPGYGAGWLLWPDSGHWNDGEIDFPEGGLSQTQEAFNHCVGHARDNCLVVNTGVTFVDWHTATIEWSPRGVFYILDGKTVASDTRNIPVKALHWVLQTGTSGNKPAASTTGHVLIDWVSIYTRA